MKDIKTTWQEELKNKKAYPKLTEHASCEVLIIGGGIAGTTITYLLAKEGKKVMMIDKGTLGDSVSAFTTAFITSVIDTEFSELEKYLGKRGVKKIINSGEDAISLMEKIINEEKIDCDFMRVPHYSFARTNSG